MKNKNTALLVIDMQLVAFDGKVTPAIANGSSLLTRIAKLITSSRESGVSLVYAQTNAASGAPYAQDTHGWEIHPSISPAPEDIVFSKVGPSLFENTSFEEWLLASKISDLIICGIWTEGCVSITARAPLQRGYNVILTADGHGTVRESTDSANAMVGKANEQLSDRGATVSNIKNTIAKLRNM